MIAWIAHHWWELAIIAVFVVALFGLCLARMAGRPLPEPQPAWGDECDVEWTWASSWRN